MSTPESPTRRRDGQGDPAQRDAHLHIIEAMRSFASIHAHDPERAALAASVAFVAMGTTTGAVMRFVTSLRQGIGQPASPSSPSPQPQTLEHDEALHGVDPDFIITAVRFARPGDKGDTKRAESADHASKLSSSQSAPSAKTQERTRSTRTAKGSKVDQSIGANGDGRSSLSRPASIVGSKWEPSNSKHLTELQVRVKINFQRDKDVPPSTLIEKYGQKYVRELADYKTYLARAKKAGRRVGRVKVPPADWTPSTSPSADGPDASAHEAKGKKRARSERHDEEESLPQKRARVGSEASESVTPSEPSIPSSSSQPRPANATKSTSARSRRASYVPSLGWRSKDYVSSLTIKTVSTKVPYLQRATPKSYRRSLKTQLAASKWADSRSALLSDRDRKVVASFNALKTVNAAFLKRKFGAPFAQSMLEYRKHRTELQELKAREIKDVLSSFRRGPSASPLLRRSSSASVRSSEEPVSRSVYTASGIDPGQSSVLDQQHDNQGQLAGPNQEHETQLQDQHERDAEERQWSQQQREAQQPRDSQQQCGAPKEREAEKEREPQERREAQKEGEAQKKREVEQKIRTESERPPRPLDRGAFHKQMKSGNIPADWHKALLAVFDIVSVAPFHPAAVAERAFSVPLPPQPGDNPGQSSTYALAAHRSSSIAAIMARLDARERAVKGFQAQQVLDLLQLWSKERQAKVDVRFKIKKDAEKALDAEKLGVHLDAGGLLPVALAGEAHRQDSISKRAREKQEKAAIAQVNRVTNPSPETPQRQVDSVLDSRHVVPLAIETEGTCSREL